MITYAKRVTDTLRGIQYNSIKEAHEVYYPQGYYSEFYHSLLKGKIPHLIADHNCSRYKGEPKCMVRQRVREVESGRTWSCITDCAKSLGVSRQAVQAAIKRKSRCKGVHLEIVEG